MENGGKTMLLKGLKLHNFRGYKDLYLSIDNDLSVLIGRNDVGKSTILEALEIFFNSDQVKLDQDDLCILHEDNDETISISCEFLVEDSEIILDTTVRTNLEEEYLYNEAKIILTTIFLVIRSLFRKRRRRRWRNTIKV